MRRLSDNGMRHMCVFSFSFSFGFITTFVEWEPDLLLTCCSQYALPVTKKGAKAAAAAEEKKEGEEKKRSNHAQRILADRRKGTHRFFYRVYFGCRSVS